MAALWPFAPPFDSLTKEDAHVENVWKDNFVVSTTSLKTVSGREVKCRYGNKSGGCHPETMKLLLANKTRVTVWHDKEKVYQLTAEDKPVLRYKRIQDSRWFAGALSFISLLLALIQFGILKGFIGVANLP